MIRVSSATSEVARRLWTRESVDATSPDAVAATIKQVCGRLRLGLGRWIGVDGYRVLLRRVLEEAEAHHPVLLGLNCLAEGRNDAAGMVHTPDVAGVIDGFVSVVALLIHLLSRVIGEEMATRLVEQAWAANPSEGSSAETRGVRDG